MATDVTSVVRDDRLRRRLGHDLRLVAAAGTAGLVAGFVVNGVGSRLAMMLLARLNPQVTGMISDDGFRMGQFTLADTAGLVGFGAATGVLGGLLFLVLRGLRVGPDWFRAASMTVGPAIVVGSMLVHSDGVDFRVLEPTWLAIGLFVALPGIFAWWVGHLVDRWTTSDAWALRTDRAWIGGLVPLVALGPALVAVVGGLAVRALRHGVPTVERVASHAALPVGARVALTAVFLVSLRSLGHDVAALL